MPDGLTGAGRDIGRLDLSLPYASSFPQDDSIPRYK